jgi:predicted O-linked N-acetylglucosamine transferase (SPINDLY family)
MAGLPVITYMGSSFPSRVAGSLLHAIDMTELVAHSLEGYEALALRLAQSPNELADIKLRIAANKTSCSLFDTQGFCINLEAVYISMWRAQQLGGVHDALGG